jgi:hypothetical protein
VTVSADPFISHAIDELKCVLKRILRLTWVISHHATGHLLEKYSNSCEIYAESSHSTVRIGMGFMSKITLLCKAAGDSDSVRCGTFRIRRGPICLYRRVVTGVTSVLHWTTSVVAHILGK